MVDFNGFGLNVYWKKRKIVEVGQAAVAFGQRRSIEATI